MELTQVQTEVPLLQPPTAAPRRSLSCFHWLSIFSFALLLVATTVLALLHFRIIPTPGNEDEFHVPEVLHIKSFLGSAPRAQGQDAQRAAAHLTGKMSGEGITWEASDMNTFQNNEFELQKQNTELKIPRDGLYFVYTQVVFTGKSCGKESILDLTHEVKRKTEEYEKVLPILTSTKTVCQVESPKPWTQPIYQGGIFQLDRDDILFTETTNVKLLNSNHGKVYFGVLAL
ncbi:tumor necrosis factor-like [Hyperolius riggenbachi]|uniref:tumor necrosis factor-like n=1 Tax=Hyperolius riggenbachi TaxID=752182 RepID=UPI0035A31D5A